MQTTTLPRPHRPYRAQPRVRRTPLDFVAIFCGVLLLTALMGCVFWQFWHAQRIYTGVQIGGVPIGGLTRAEAIRTLNEELTTYPLPLISLRHAGTRWPLLDETAASGTPGAALRADVDLVTAVNQAYLVGRQGGAFAQLSEQLRTAAGQQSVTPPITYDRGQLRYLISRVADQVRRPPRAAQQVGTVTIPAQAGVEVDVEATLQAVLQALERTEAPNAVLTIPLVTRELPPATVAASTTAAAQADVASPLLADLTPLRVVHTQSGQERAIDPAALQEMVLSTQPLRLDPEQLRAYLSAWAEQLYRPARDARLQFNPDTGTVNILQTSRTGRELNIDDTMASIQLALETNRPQAALVLQEVAPAVDMNRIPEMGIQELVASSTTYFAGSSAARIHNIEVAAEKFEGVVIPPGELFSFNEIVEDVSSANGFEDSLIIWGDQTAVGVGGGVCQVSTTVFRAAFAAGLPIVERYNHGYVVSWYGDPGLDATIYTPTVDFKFRNDTDAYLLIDPVVDSANGVITFNLYGTKPDRQVIIGEAQVSDVIEPDTPKYIEDPSLPDGAIEQVEWANRGMTVEIPYTIIEDGEAREKVLTSTYRPWRAQYLYGPGAAVPTPAPTPDATGEGEEGGGTNPAESTPETSAVPST